MADLDLWFREVHRDHIALGMRVKRNLWSGKSEYQTLDVIDTHGFGRVLLLDGLVMTTERDEFIYHEMVAHTALSIHPDPRSVLIIGGGDGGTAREAIKHPTVERVDLVEIDRLVVEKSREYLPTIGCALDHPKVHLHFKDGIQWVANREAVYDVIVVDSTDPIGPAVGLFTESFYAACYRALTEDGVLSAQTESPIFDPTEMKAIHQNLAMVFPQVRPYTAPIPSYPGGLWSFALATKGAEATTNPDPERYTQLTPSLKYYNPDVHRAAFALPNYLLEMLAE